MTRKIIKVVMAVAKRLKIVNTISPLLLFKIKKLRNTVGAERRYPATDPVETIPATTMENIRAIKIAAA